jgi:hypothetical protein
MASLSNFQTQPFSTRLSERRPMNSTMKGFSQSYSGIRRKRSKAASKVWIPALGKQMVSA